MATWYAGSHSTDSGNNTGWVFTAPPGGGTLSIQLDDVTTALSGTLQHAGTASIQLNDATPSASGSITHGGTGSIQLGDASPLLSGALIHSGTVSVQLNDAVISATGYESHGGPLSIQLDDVAIAMSGSGINSGTLALQLEGIGFNASGFTTPAPEIGGGANPWGEKARKARAITEERIRKAKADEVERIIRSLRDDGVIPDTVVEDIPDYSQVRRLYAAQLAQIAQNAAEEYERITQEEEFLMMLMID